MGGLSLSAESGVTLKQASMGAFSESFPSKKLTVTQMEHLQADIPRICEEIGCPFLPIMEQARTVIRPMESSAGSYLEGCKARKPVQESRVETASNEQAIEAQGEGKTIAGTHQTRPMVMISFAADRHRAGAGMDVVGAAVGRGEDLAGVAQAQNV
jgi:hypothetical protein